MNLSSGIRALSPVAMQSVDAELTFPRVLCEQKRNQAVEAVLNPEQADGL
jgi:hypothetical protein